MCSSAMALKWLTVAGSRALAELVEGVVEGLVENGSSAEGGETQSETADEEIVLATATWRTTYL